jgi:hypothetical protein
MKSPGASLQTKYSTRSAYTAQFLGSFADNNWGKLWKVKAENKCKVWAWLILQNKLKNVDRIMKNGGSANPVCQLCYTHNESAAHMLLSCPYSRAVWQQLKEWSGLEPLQPPTQPYRRLKTWWNRMLFAGRTNRTTTKNKATKFIYTTWNI